MKKQQWIGSLEGYDSHGFCKRLCAERRKELKVKMKDIGVMLDLGKYLVTFPKPYDYYLGYFEGCCKWDAIIRACKYVEEREKERKKTKEINDERD